MQEKKHLIILSDYGLDDAAALVYILNNRSLFDGIDVVTVGGNTDAETSFVNAQKLLAAFEKENGKLDGVTLVDTKNLPQFSSHLPSIHGEDGMGDFLPQKISACPVVFFKDYVKNLPKRACLVSLGPCTVTKIIMDLRPEFELLIMAGMVNAQPNFKGMEYNQALDVENFDYCVKLNHSIATLDTCRMPCFNMVGKSIGTKTLFQKTVARALHYAVARHPDNCYIYDLCCVMYLTNPQDFETVKTLDPWGNNLYQLMPKESLKIF